MDASTTYLVNYEYKSHPSTSFSIYDFELSDKIEVCVLNTVEEKEEKEKKEEKDTPLIYKSKESVEFLYFLEYEQTAFEDFKFKKRNNSSGFHVHINLPHQNNLDEFFKHKATALHKFNLKHGRTINTVFSTLCQYGFNAYVYGDRYLSCMTPFSRILNDDNYKYRPSKMTLYLLYSSYLKNRFCIYCSGFDNLPKRSKFNNNYYIDFSEICNPEDHIIIFPTYMSFYYNDERYSNYDMYGLLYNYIMNCLTSSLQTCLDKNYFEYCYTDYKHM